jgi:serine/threonine-protein kinase RsbW
VQQPTVHLALAAEAVNVGVCRQAFMGMCEALGLDENIQANVGLAVTEACTNVVLHAYSAADAPGLMEIDVFGGDGLTIVVRDEGRGPATYSEAGGMGLGLPLIAAIADSLALRSGPNGRGTEVVMRFALTGAV